MIDRRLFVLLFLLTTVCRAADLPPLYDDVQEKFQDARPHLTAIENELKKDHLWQLVPHYVDGSFEEPHIPNLTDNQIVKYRNLLMLVPSVSYIDVSEDRTGFSLGIDSIDHRNFSFQYVHTTRQARPENCDDAPIDELSGVCSVDLGNNWALWVSWFEQHDAKTE